ncbi:hypothetical protein [Streptomyces acidiscabies]|uniref:Uncharacterized protein n=1 Tax=Streptomyces acidiscabies TaxID=42234 RepID=A0A0L0JXC3_9ACTN|nr:hypothetical protein [Streptomyces acidiscabies]KND30204.1 hypothetical protein IQ63_29495 [Streptomyces acidiscabies]
MARLHLTTRSCLQETERVREHGMTQARAVRFDGYGGRGVLYVAEVVVPEPPSPLSPQDSGP